MKNKPTRHKESNTFKFQPFSQRITCLDIDVFHRIGHKNEEYNEEETYFHQTLRKWNVLNLTDCYEEFRKELPCVETLPLLLNQSDKVIEVILKHLSKNDPLSLQAILDLLAALMKDLRHEIYPAYSNVLKTLCQLLSSKDADVLEWVFTSLAYMFKYLWRYIVKDLETVFHNLLPLFSKSKPAYINNFVAESFAYVARKVKNRKEFVKLLLRTLETHPDSVEGCGRLMFEVLKGINQRFHSLAPEFVHSFMEMLYDPSINVDLLYEILKHMCAAMCVAINSKHVQPFWNESLSVLSQFYEDSSTLMNPLIFNLKLIHQVIEYKSGVLLSDPSSTVSNLLKLFDKGNCEEVSQVMSSIVATILLSEKVPLSQENAYQMTSRVLKLPFESTVLEFVFQVLEYSGFEALILPWIQKYVLREIKNCLKSSSMSDYNVFSFLSRIIVNKAPPSFNGIDLDSWNRYPLDFVIMFESKRDDNKSVVEYFFNENFLDCETMDICHIEYFINLCLVLPHLNLNEKKPVINKLNVLMNVVCSKITNCKAMELEDKSSIQKLLFLFLIVLEAYIHMAEFHILKDICSLQFMVDTILPLATNPQYISALSAFDLYLTTLQRDEDTSSMNCLVDKIFHSLSDNLSSPFHKIRLLTTHSLFLLSTCDKKLTTISSYFKNCFQSESIKPSILIYREKLSYLQRLSCDLVNADSNSKSIMLQYLLGVFYINFQLLWEPVADLINSYAKGMAISDFWNVFGSRLNKAAEDIQLRIPDVPNNDVMENEYLSEMWGKFHNLDDKPDFSNYRILLWKCFLKFPEVCEVKSKDVTPLFFTFLECEYFVVNSDDYFLNIKQFESSVNDVIKEGKDTARKKNTENQAKFSHVHKSLIAHMNIFAKVRNPKVIYGESRLREYYYDFLMSKNPHIQKSALDCIMTYKEKYLVPYSSHLYGLLDDQAFKGELIKFQIGKESSIIQEEHRHNLIPVLIRILYGRMTAKSVKSGSRKTPDGKRAIVLRFLSGCHDSEIQIFLELAFRIYLPYVQDNSMKMVEALNGNVDLNHVISLKRLKHSLNMLLTVMENIGGLMGIDVLSFVFRLMLCIAGYSSSILSKKTEIYSGYSSGLRVLKNSSLVSVTKFFSQFTNYPWSSQDLDAVFTVFVWPSVEKLHIEGIHSPTPLLKLFAAWSREPKYFYLLVKSKESDNTVVPLSSIMKLLIGPKVNPTVTSLILEIIESLLTTADSTEENDAELALKGKNLEKELNYGSKIILPYVPMIIEHLQHKLTLRKKKGLSRRDLLILSRVCELQVDSHTSEGLLELLFQTFAKKVDGPEETIIYLISTVCSLLKNVQSPFKYARSIAPLFGTISPIDARKMLCQLLIDVTEKEEEKRGNLRENVKLVQDINAWDAKWVEQPDFARRLDGFKNVHCMIEKGKMLLDIGLIIVHNCFFLLKHENDLSLRDSSGYCLRKLSPYLCNLSMPTKDYSTPESFLKLISAGIHEKSNEIVYQEAVGLLGELVRECPDIHPIIQDMKGLACKEDPEVDFFNNISHLQPHRRAKALMRFCAVAKKMSKRPRTHTLIQFILPLASSYLCEEKYAHKKNVVDASICTVGIVCSFLPWYHYERVLRFYLNKLRTLPAFQKQMVHVIISILDAFHFDFANLKKVNDQGDLIKYSEEKVDSSELSVNTSSPLDSSGNKILVTKTDPKGTSSNSQSAEDDTDSVHKEILEKKEEQKEDEEKVDDAELSDLDEIECEEEDEDENQTQNITEEINCTTTNMPPAIMIPLKLSASAAERVINSLTKGLLQQLLKAIGECKSGEQAHKVNKKKTAAEQEEEDTMCIPLALAIVKLLQKLPSQYMDLHLSCVFLNICKFLKSRLESVRRVAREMLQKIMASLGPTYLSTLLGEMTSLLTKGFQNHVLIFTIHSVLSSMKETFKLGDMDGSLKYVLDICKMDLFGVTSEEKEVSKIIGKVVEARSHKSYDTLRISAQFISEKCLIDLLEPIKDVLVTTSSHSELVRVSECLRHIVSGLNDNEFIPLTSLLIFIYGVISGNIGLFNIKDVKEKKENKKNSVKKVRQPDCLIIPEAPRTRYGAITAKPVVSTDRNAHMLTEFGFNLLHIFLKRGKVDPDIFRSYVDPIVPYLVESINAKYVKLTTVTLKCLLPAFSMNLPSMKENINTITTSIFSLLHKYATGNQSQGEYMDMVLAAFKTVTVLVREVKYHNLTETQLKTLLLYVDQDMHDTTRQATAFPLLKAILKRQLDSPEIEPVMVKVSELSVISEHDHVRAQARQVLYYYLMHYPLGKKVRNYINFYLQQLNYELEHGRLSALQMLHRLIATFPDHAVKTYAGVCFVALGAALVNDERPECKKMCFKCLKQLVSRAETVRDDLFGMTMVWLSDGKVSHRQLGAHVCGVFVEVLKDKFTRYLSTVISKVHSILRNESMENRPEKFVQGESKPGVGSENLKEKTVKKRDYCSYQVLVLLKKVCGLCPAFLTDKRWTEDVDNLGEICQYLLGHPHVWIRLEASGVLGYMFDSLDTQYLIETISSAQYIEGRFLFHNTGNKLKSLILDLCAQLHPGTTSSALIEQVVKNLAFLGRFLISVPEDIKISADGIELSVSWMIRRMRRVVNFEIVQTPSSYLLRNAVFKWIGAMIVNLPKVRLEPLMSQFLTPLARELLNEEQSDPDLLTLVRGIVKIIKKKLGITEYTEHLSKVQALLAAKRAIRKKDRKQEAISNPEMAAKRKIKKQQKKKILKKKKMDEYKGRVAPKRKFKPKNSSDTEDFVPSKRRVKKK